MILLNNLFFQENLETAALRIESKGSGGLPSPQQCFWAQQALAVAPSGSTSQWRKVGVMDQLSKAFEPWQWEGGQFGLAIEQTG